MAIAMRISVLWVLWLVLAPVLAVSWNFSPPLDATQTHGEGIYHHLGSSGRNGIAVSETEVALVWEDNRDGGRLVLAWEDRRKGHSVILAASGQPPLSFAAPRQINESFWGGRALGYGRGTGAMRVSLASADGEQALAVETRTSGAQSLDGLQFQGTTGEKGKGDHHEDTIMFEDGRFRSLDCENWGFGAAPYSVKETGGSVHFTATLHSVDRGKLEWEGTIVGDMAEAAFRWEHKRWYWDIDREYWFQGKRRETQTD